MSIRTWLVQRLQRARVLQDGVETPLGRLGNAFAFGGGLINGGLSREAMAAFHGIFRFDYMGAAEYEFGDVPKAFAALAELRKKDQLACFTVKVAGSRIKDKHTVVPAGHTVWFFAADTPEMRQHCQAWLTHQVNDTDDRAWRTRDRTHIQQQLNPSTRDAQRSYQLETIGGIALGDHPFCYFMEVEPAQKFAELFELKCSEKDTDAT